MGRWALRYFWHISWTNIAKITWGHHQRFEWTRSPPCFAFTFIFTWPVWLFSAPRECVKWQTSTFSPVIHSFLLPQNVKTFSNRGRVVVVKLQWRADRMQIFATFSSDRSSSLQRVACFSLDSSFISLWSFKGQPFSFYHLYTVYHLIVDRYYVYFVFGLCTLTGSITKYTKHLPQADDIRCSSEFFWLLLLLLREIYLLFVLAARFTFWGQECLGSLSTVMQGGPTNCIWRRGKCNHIHHETFSSQHRKPSCSPFALQEARKSVYSLLVIQILYAFSGWWNENNVNVDLQTASPFIH